MARTLQTIYNELIASKEVNTDLDTLLPNPDNWQQLYTFENFKLLANTITKSLSTSKVAIWRLIMYSVAYGIWMQEKLYDLFLTDVDDLTTNREFGQLPWYTKVSKEFQIGYELEWINDSYYGYSTIDEEAQVITQSATTLANGVIVVKVARGEVGSLEKLTSDQLNAFTQYMKGSSRPLAEDGVIPAGTNVSIISEDPDELRFAIQVFYNSQVLDREGKLLTDGTTKPVEEAITEYIQQIPFDSKFKISGLIDAIQIVNGVNNVVATNCDAKFSTQDWADSTNVITEIGKQYIAFAGYLKMGDDHPLDGFYDFPANLTRTITYIEDE